MPNDRLIMSTCIVQEERELSPDKPAVTGATFSMLDRPVRYRGAAVSPPPGRKSPPSLLGKTTVRENAGTDFE